MDHEGAGIDVADRVDQADDPPGAAHVEPGQRLTEGVEVEERVAGKYLRSVGEEPAVDLHLLIARRPQLGPRVGPAARRPQPGDAQLRAVGVRQRLELVELVDVVAGHYHGDLERPEPGVAQRVHRPPRGGVRTATAHRVIRRGIDAVEADLHVEVVHRRQAVGGGGVEERAVGRELDADPVADGVVDELEEVAPDHRLAAADVDVEHLQPLQLVEHALGLGGRQLAGIAPPG